MASRRMFSLAVVDTDLFQDMPPSAQALYFHLGLHGDDDGFVSSPRKITRGAGCSEEDLKTLCGKGLIIPFDNGVIVIRDWLLNNTVKNDRYKPTIYQAQMALLVTDEANRYQLVSSLEPGVIQTGNNVEPQLNRTEQNITQSNGERADRSHTRSQFEPPSVDDVKAFAEENGLVLNAGAFCDYYAARGWHMGNVPMVDWKAAARAWERRESKDSVSAPSQPPRNDLARAERLLAERKRGAADE